MISSWIVGTYLWFGAMFSRDKKWILTYFPAAWLGHICQGLAMGIIGPAQPYLAAMVGVTNEEINLIWTLRALGSCLATLLTGMVFKKYFVKQNMKLAFLGLSVLLVGVFMGLVPWTSSFYVLLLSMIIIDQSHYILKRLYLFIYSNYDCWSIPWQFLHSKQLPGPLHAGAGQVTPLYPVPPCHGGPWLHAGFPGHQALPTRQSGTSESLATIWEYHFGKGFNILTLYRVQSQKWHHKGWCLSVNLSSIYSSKYVDQYSLVLGEQWQQWCLSIIYSKWNKN